MTDPSACYLVSVPLYSSHPPPYSQSTNLLHSGLPLADCQLIGEREHLLFCYRHHLLLLGSPATQCHAVWDQSISFQTSYQPAIGLVKCANCLQPQYCKVKQQYSNGGHPLFWMPWNQTQERRGVVNSQREGVLGT